VQPVHALKKLPHLLPQRLSLSSGCGSGTSSGFCCHYRLWVQRRRSLGSCCMASIAAAGHGAQGQAGRQVGQSGAAVAAAGGAAIGRLGG
jgi:hypothetical protein